MSSRLAFQCCLSRLPCDIDMFDHDNFLLESGISLFDASSASCVERSRAMTGLTFVPRTEVRTVSHS